MLSTAILRSSTATAMVITACIGTKNPCQLLIILGHIKEYFFQRSGLVETDGSMTLTEAVHETIEILVGDWWHSLDAIVPVIDHTTVIVNVSSKE